LSASAEHPTLSDGQISDEPARTARRARPDDPVAWRHPPGL